MSRSIKEILNSKDDIQLKANIIFNSADTNESGFIERSELTKLLLDISKELGVKPPTKNDISDYMQVVDTDKNGKISEEEFIKLVEEFLTLVGQDEEN